jgi:hypothetical protein
VLRRTRQPAASHHGQAGIAGRGAVNRGKGPLIERGLVRFRFPRVWVPSRILRRVFGSFFGRFQPAIGTGPGFWGIWLGACNLGDP